MRFTIEELQEIECCTCEYAEDKECYDPDERGNCRNDCYAAKKGAEANITIEEKTTMKELYVSENEIPQSCDECPLKDIYSDFPNIYCNVTFEVINDGEDIEENRHSTCPLRILKSN